MSMTLDEASKFFRLKLDVLKDLKRMELIDEPLSQIDIDVLSLFQHTWGDDNLLRKQLMEKTPRKRKQLIGMQNPLTKVEKYIYGRYFKLKKGERVSTDLIAMELKTHFGVSFKKSLTGQIIEIRKRAQADRKKSRHKGQQQ